MRIANLMVIGLLLAICWGVLGCSASAGDYTIEKVIEIGPADWVPFLGPIRWSPDGTKISYFSQGYLMISDTLGNKRQIAKVDMLPYRFEWLSNNEVVICFWQHNPSDESNKIVSYNLEDSTQTTLLDKTLRYSDTIDYAGIFRSIEGTLYYTQEIATPKHKVEHNFLITASDSIIDTAAIMASNHFYRWGNNGLYRIRLDLFDSTRVTPKPYSNIFRCNMTPDGRYVLDGGTIGHLADSSYFMLDTLFKERPQGTLGCAFILPSFTSNSEEVALTVSCDYDEYHTIDNAGIFNFANKKITLISQRANLSEGIAPTFTYDGNKIGLISNNKLYIIFRGAQ